MWRRDRYRTGQHSNNDMHTSLEKKNNCDLVNHQHFRLVSSTKVKIDLVIVFIYKDPFSSRLRPRSHLTSFFSCQRLFDMQPYGKRQKADAFLKSGRLLKTSKKAQLPTPF